MRTTIILFALLGSALLVGACAAQRCQSCHGEYGRWGRSGTSGCLCRTTDAQKECRGQEDCQGDCLLRRWEVVRTEDSGQEWGVPVGACAEFEITFGCGPRLGHKADAQKPVKLPADENSLRMCVD